MKVVIVEDDFIVAEDLESILNSIGVQTLSICTTADEALKTILQKPDLYLIDIRLEGMKSGIDLAKVLYDRKILFAFLTANNEIATLKKAIQYNPLAYISKPYREYDIIALIELFKLKFKTIEIKSKFGKKKVAIKDILYVEADGAYVNIITEIETFNERNSLDFYLSVAPSIFIRIHRSYIVNVNQVDEYNSSCLYVKGKELHISRSYKDQVLAHFNQNSR